MAIRKEQMLRAIWEHAMDGNESNHVSNEQFIDTMRRLANHGFSPAQHTLGNEIIKNNPKEAVIWLTRAFAQTDIDKQEMIRDDLVSAFGANPDNSEYRALASALLEGLATGHPLDTTAKIRKSQSNPKPDPAT